MLKRISLLIAISLHTLMWGGVASGATSEASPKCFSLPDIFKPCRLPISKISSSDVLRALGKLLPVHFQKRITSNQTMNCPACPTAPYHIGDFAQGGVIIWLTNDGLHGLVAAREDAATNAMWGPTTASVTIKANTILPLSTPNDPYGQYYGGYINQNNPNVKNNLNLFESFTAAANYSIIVKGVTYDDWWLPSSRELSLMYAAVEVINQVSEKNGGSSMSEALYWSSREQTANSAWSLDFSNGTQNVSLKTNDLRVRCVRAF